MKTNSLARIDLLDIIQVRTIVLALGEAHHFGWWKSGFLSPTGLSFLERLYPHTYFAAAIRSSGLAALGVHDYNIGKGHIFHLFRLTQGVERELEIILKENEGTLKSHFQNSLGDQRFLLSALEEIANGQITSEAVGPALINSPSEKMVSMLSAYYLHGFLQKKQVFPYF
jgi:hypothetical protein